MPNRRRPMSRDPWRWGLHSVSSFQKSDGGGLSKTGSSVWTGRNPPVVDRHSGISKRSEEISGIP